MPMRSSPALMAFRHLTSRPWDGASSCDPTDPIQNDVNDDISGGTYRDYEVAVGMMP